MSARYEARGPVGRVVNSLEETFIAVILGLMTILTFAAVVVRYLFNGPFGEWLEGTIRWWSWAFPSLEEFELINTILWGQEVVLILFAWLVIFGVSYGAKATAHLGVDALINVLSPKVRKILALIAAVVCLGYAALLLKGAWDYWAPFAGLNATEGRWFPTGFADSRDQGWYETDQVPIPFAHAWLEETFNFGEEYEKLPRFIPYVILPVGMALLLFRFIQATIGLATGRRESLIVSHEAEDDVREAAHVNAER